MEYERIDKVLSGISPSKLRMKLMGPHNLRKKNGSNSNSSRTSPSRIDDSEFVNSLLASKNGHFHEQVKVSNELLMDSSLNEQISSQSKESSKSLQFSKSDNGNSSSIHPMRTVEDENLDSDSNASSSSFEFHKGERALSASVARSYSRPMSSKWNYAEKWILNKQNMQAIKAKKNAFQNQANGLPITNVVRAAEYFFKLGVEGKRFRPTVLLLMATALNVHIPEPAGGLGDFLTTELRTRQQSIAEITEMIHVASLLHDDVLDDADKSRVLVH